MPGFPPPPPPRGRMPSYDHSGELWQAVGGLQRDVAEVKALVATQSAGVRSQTIQLIVAGVVTCVTAVFGARMTAPTPPATTTVVQRSAFDRALDTCKAMQTDPERAKCIVEVTAQAMGPLPR